MTEPNPFRAEVALQFGEQRLILRCSYAALTKMLPWLEASPEVAAKRLHWLTVQQEQFGWTPPPLERWEWNHHLLGALAAREIETVARCIAILAEDHHPDVTFERVMDQSPSWGLLAQPFHDLVMLFHYKPGEEPEALKEDIGTIPFGALKRLLGTLSRLRSQMASQPPSSAA